MPQVAVTEIEYSHVGVAQIRANVLSFDTDTGLYTVQFDDGSTALVPVSNVVQIELASEPADPPIVQPVSTLMKRGAL